LKVKDGNGVNIENIDDMENSVAGESSVKSKKSEIDGTYRTGA